MQYTITMKLTEGNPKLFATATVQFEDFFEFYGFNIVPMKENPDLCTVIMPNEKDPSNGFPFILPDNFREELRTAILIRYCKLTQPFKPAVLDFTNPLPNMSAGTVVLNLKSPVPSETFAVPTQEFEVDEKSSKIRGL